jgi:hypothetical protein
MAKSATLNGYKPNYGTDGESSEVEAPGMGR